MDEDKINDALQAFFCLGAIVGCGLTLLALLIIESVVWGV